MRYFVLSLDEHLYLALNNLQNWDLYVILIDFFIIMMAMRCSSAGNILVWWKISYNKMINQMRAHDTLNQCRNLAWQESLHAHCHCLAIVCLTFFCETWHGEIWRYSFLNGMTVRQDICRFAQDPSLKQNIDSVRRTKASVWNTVANLTHEIDTLISSSFMYINTRC